MGRRKPAYDLGAIQSAARAGMSVTTGAVRGAAAMGMTRSDMMRVIQGLTRRDFYKSVTTYQDHSIWMDVYHGRAEGYEIYIKFVQDVVTEFTCTSFKEK
jgi:motility quorum-sensing regulator/GCU-specific mRNA interferase toxin